MQKVHSRENVIHAAIDIGSNTIHLVIAKCTPDQLEILLDEQELVRIGESVTANGEISAQKRDAAISVLSHYQALAKDYTSLPPLVVATEAIRKAHNKQQFLADIQDATGLNVHIIDGNVEALLTFYGATYELYQEACPPSLVGVLDLGGGSMELVAARKKRIIWHTSVPLGSGWLHDHYLQSDPPTLEDQEVAHTFLSTYINGLHIKQRPPVMIATGGSANSLLLLARRALNLSEQETHLTYEQIVRCEGLLYSLSATEISERYDQPLKRAVLLPAGAMIITTLMTHLQLSSIRVSTHGIREGALLAYARYGEQWLQELQKDASTQDDSTTVESEDEALETFAQSASRLLLERTYKMLEWRAEVLKHEDIEAVHKMRVASRRLRALLDAYEAACDKKKFRQVYRQIKEIADVLGKARDTDVMIERLQRQLAEAAPDAQPGLQWLIERLHAYRQAYQKHLEAFLQTLDDDALVRQVEACLPGRGGTIMAKAEPITGLDIHASTTVNARIIAGIRLAELFDWEQYVDDPYRVHELHNLRIAAKRLRYTLEIFEDVLPASIAPLRGEVEQLQEELGNLHDSDVMIALLRLCLGTLDGGSGYAYALAHAHKIRKKADFAINPAMITYLLDPAQVPSAEERHGLETLLAGLHQQRNEQYHTFRQHWYQLKTKNFRLTVLNMLDFK